ncbi:MAG: sugar phosphate isomerase/epimerase [Lentisphaerae bacterium]|jgi:sugar phosphate isomerase/epimerase|nr:sugar phosphate isomerase/epimerase [Lentisphaerota bacterium]
MAKPFRGYFTGFADEAASDLAGQIRATKTLGWKNIESRAIDGVNIHDLPEPDFDRAVAQLEDAGIAVNCFGSTIANWSKKITDPFEDTLAGIRRTIPRMQRLGSKQIRIMSYARLDEREPADQMAEERFRRLREITAMFLDSGIQPLHENCMNYGGMGWPFTLKMLENVPGLKLVFDTGNPIGSADYSKNKPYPRQSSWEFYQKVREHIAYIHIKDGHYIPEKDSLVCTWPGEGDGDVRKILHDLLSRGYQGGISIEPHMQVIFHDSSVKADPKARFDNYVQYGQKLEALVQDICAKL